MKNEIIFVEHETGMSGLADYAITYSDAQEKFTGIASMLQGLEKVILYVHYVNNVITPENEKMKYNELPTIVYREYDGGYKGYPVERTFEQGVGHECPEVIITEFLVSLFKPFFINDETELELLKSHRKMKQNK